MNMSDSHYNQKFLDERRQDLLRQREATIADLKEISSYDEASGKHIPLQPDYDVGSVEDTGDSGEEAEELQERMSRVNDLEETLDEIDLALSKLNKGTYGRCEVTGDWIKEDRLKAYPAARTCMEDSK